MGMLNTKDGTKIYYKDWGTGKPVVFSHGWPLNSDSWESQMLHMAANGYRSIAHDRRGHGRSSQPWSGNDMDTYADDLDELIQTLDLHEICLVGFSTGGGEVARYIARHGTGRVSKVVLVSSVTPFMLKTPDNLDGIPREVFDELRVASLADRSQFYKNLADGPFFGTNHGPKPSEGIRDAFWLQGMQVGLRNALESIRAFSETDFRPDMGAIDVPTLVIHGENDRIVPFYVGGEATAALIKGAMLKVYPQAPHGLTETHKAKLSADLLEFLGS